MKFEDFELRERFLTRSEVDEWHGSAYYVGIGSRQKSPRMTFHFDRYPKVVVMSDNASNCLTGFCLLNKGILVYHDLPLTVLHERLPIGKFDKGRGLIGGSLDHWESVRDVYNNRNVRFTYAEKPRDRIRDTDLSFAFKFDLGRRKVDFGYYHNPKGLSGDAWNWE